MPRSGKSEEGADGSPGRRPGNHGAGAQAGARERLYGGALRAARALSPLAGALRPSLAPWLSERRAAAATLEEWADSVAPSERGPLLWLHGASAGELLGVAPALNVLRDRLAARLMVTHFSLSGASAAASLEPDWHGYPPFDAPSDCRRAVHAASPTALVFAAGDLWLGLSRAAAEAGVPVGMVNAAVRPRSRRLRAPARWLLAPGYRRLERVGAVSLEDAERLRRLGVPAAAMRITGDAAFDRALERAAAARRALDEASFARPGRPEPRGAGAKSACVLVAGSTWPDDEEALLRSAAALTPHGLAPRLVLVPHQPHARAVQALRRRCREILNRDPLVWSEAVQAAADEPDVFPRVPSREAAATGAPAVHLRRLLSDPEAAGRPVVVDAVGFLADLYAAGDLAWVGGGFGRSGLHSVIEPAAAGIPVLFGPRHERREAEDLLARGAARAADARALPGALAALAGDPAARQEEGRRAREYVQAGAGASAATAGLLAELLTVRRPAAKRQSARAGG